MTGAMIHDANTIPTPFQLTALKPLQTTVMPIMPPMHECVVDTGRPLNVARISHAAVLNNTQTMPNISTCYG